MSNLYNFGVEADFSQALSQQRANEEALNHFRAILSEITNEKAQNEHREDQLLLLFTRLRTCSHALTLEVLELLASLIGRRPALMTGCSNLLPLVIRTITELINANAISDSDSSTSTGNDLLSALYVKLFHLVGLVGAESITVRDVNRLFRLFQLTVDRRSSPVLCRLLLSAISDMANAHEKKRFTAPTFPSPSAFFEFQGPQPAIVIPPMDAWPAPKSYTISLWIRWDHDQHAFNESQRKLISAQQQRPVQPQQSQSLFGLGRRPAQPLPHSHAVGFVPSFAYLYSFLTAKARGVEACIEKHSCKLYLRSAGKNGQIEINTDVEIPRHQWCLVTIIHSKPKTMFTSSSGNVSVCINDSLRYEGELAFPVIGEGVASNAVGANITNIKPLTAFTGRIGAMYMFNRALSVQQVSTLVTKGSDFPMSTIAVGERSGLLKSLAKSTLSLVLRPMLGTSGGGGSGSDGALSLTDSSHLEWFKSLIFLYHPKCVEHGMAIHDLSPEYTKTRSTLNATMAAGVDSRSVTNVKEVLHCMIGGVRAFFPIFWHIDALSPPFTAATRGRSSASLLPLAVQTLTALIKENPSNQKEMIECNGLAVLGFILAQPKQIPAHHLNEYLITAIEELVQYTSWIKSESWYRTVTNINTNTVSDNTSSGNDSKSLSSQPDYVPGTTNYALPLAVATDKSLFNQLFKDILFNFSLWIRASHTEQLSIARLCRSHVSKQPKYFRRLIHPSVIFDRMRKYLSYEDCIQSEMVRDIREKEAARSSVSVAASPSHQSSLPTSQSFNSFSVTNISAGSDPLLPSPPRDLVIATRLRQLRSLRSEWFQVLRDLMLSDLSPRSLSSNLSSLIQVCCDLSDSLQIAEVMELLTSLSFAAPDQVLHIVHRFGGPMLFITILQRHSQHVHVQVATFHLLSAILRGLPPDVKTESVSQLNAIFAAIQDCLMPHSFTLPAYHACMELVLSLAPGTLGVKNGAEFAVDFNFKQNNGVENNSLDQAPNHLSLASQPASPRRSEAAFYFPSSVSFSTSNTSTSAASVLVPPPVSSSFSSMAFARQSSIKFPLGLELMFELTRKDTQPSLQSLSSPVPASAPPSHITRHVPSMPMAQLLIDLDALLAASPSQCSVILQRWPAWPKSLIAQLDWNSDTAPASLSQSPSLTLASSPRASTGGLFDLDNFTSGKSTNLESRNQLDIFLASSQQQPAQDVFADLLTQSSSTLTNTTHTGSNANTDNESLPLLSSRILETLLYHSIVHLKDGWLQWRDTLMFLRDATNAFAISEERFRATRRELFIGLLQRIRQSSQSDFYLTTGALGEQFKLNLAHVIDIMEEILYFHEIKQPANTSASERVASPPASSADDGLELASLTVTDPTATSVAGSDGPADDDEKWTLVNEEDTTDILQPSTSSTRLGADSLAVMGTSSTSVDHIRFMRHEWVLVSELLACLQSLSFPLQPLRHLNARNESSSFFDAMKGNGEEPQPVRPGSPLRAVLRILLDCIASLITAANISASESINAGSEESGLSMTMGGLAQSHAQPQNRQLSSMLNSLQSIAARELGPASVPSVAIPTNQSAAGAKAVDRASERLWRNRYSLLVLYRLCALTRSSPETMRPTLLSACKTLVDLLQPFTLVSSLNFVSGSENADGIDRIVYIPLIVTDSAQLDIAQSFNFQLSQSAYEIPALSTSIVMSPSQHSQSSHGGDLALAQRRIEESLQLASPRSSLAALYPSSFTKPQSSSSYTKVMRGCMDYVNSSVKLVSNAESRAAAEFAVLVTRTHAAVSNRLANEREAWHRLSNDMLRGAARSLASSQYTEANRKAVVDALWRESQRELSELWRSYQWQLFVEGSAWLPASMAGKRRFWQIDSTEDQQRMRRKLKQFHEGSDLRQSSQSYIQHESNKSATSGGKSKSAVRELTVSTDDSGAGSEPSLSTSPGVSVAIGDTTASIEDVDRAQLAMIESKLHVRNIGDEDTAAAINAEDQDANDPLESQINSEAVNHGDSDNKANDGDEAQSVASETESEASSTVTDTDTDATTDTIGDENSELPDDWDMLSDQFDLNRPVISTNSNAYTSPSVLLVLPFTTLAGTLEIGSRYFQFVPNLNAEMTDRNGRAIHSKSGDGRRVWTLPGLDAQRKRAKKNRLWSTNEIVGVYRRRYALQKTAIEIFLSNSKNYFLDFGSREERRTVMEKILALKPPKLNKLLSLRAWDLIGRLKLTQRWQRREISNFDYLMALNTISGRTYNDLNQYPVFPWILTYYPNKGEEDANVNLIHVINSDTNHPHADRVFRDLSKPIGALDENRFEQVLERYQSMVSDHNAGDKGLPPYHYGSHYSNAGIVMYYLLRCEPFASLHVEFQAGKFDFSDRLFHSIAQTWQTCLKSLSCFKELTPEFFYSAAFLDNINGFDLGVKQDGSPVNNVILPAWAADSAEFVRIHRLALESEYVSNNLHQWIDLTFGYKQKGKAAAEAHNLFFHLTYEGAVDIGSIKDPVLQTAVKDQIALFGQTPMQVFRKPHPQRGPRLVERIERLKPPPQFLMGGAQYLNPPLRRVAAMPDRTPLIAVRCCSGTSNSNRWLTVSSSFVVGVHLWQSHQQDEVIERLPNNQSRRITLPFTHSLAAIEKIEKQSPLRSTHVLVSDNGKLLFEANNWDDSLRVYALTTNINTVGLKDRSQQFGSIQCTLQQHLRQHKARVTCLAASGKTLVSGSADCTLLVWSIETGAVSKIAGLSLTEGRQHLSHFPRHRLRGHEHEILGCAVNEELDICASTSSRGLVLLHSLRKGMGILRVRVPSVAQLTDGSATIEYEELVRGAGFVDSPIEVDYGIEDDQATAIFRPTSPRSSTSAVIEATVPRAPVTLVHSLIHILTDGALVFASAMTDFTNNNSKTQPQLAVCGVNGRNWRAVLVSDVITAITSTADGKLLATGSDSGDIVIRRAHDLRVIQRFEPCPSVVSSLTFTSDEEYLIAASNAGDLNVLAVHC